MNIVSSGGGSAEIGAIVLDGAGTAPTAGAAGTTTAGGTTTTTTTTTGNFPAPGTPGGAPTAAATASTQKFALPTLPGAPALTVTTAPLDVNITGNAKVDVYEVTSPILTSDGSLSPGLGNVTSLKNSTGGEIVNIHLNNIGTLSSNGAVGAAVETNTPSIVRGNIRNHHTTEDGTEGAPYSYPLYEVSSLVRVVGRIVSFSAACGLAATPTSASSRPQGRRPIRFRFRSLRRRRFPTASPTTSVTHPWSEACLGRSLAALFVANGSINSISIQGMNWRGSGATNSVGLFATGLLGPISDSGDIRGIITSAIGSVGLSVHNGSILGAVYGSLARFDFAEDTAEGIVIPTSLTSITHPTIDVGNISVSGNGGIIGSMFVGEHFGTISVSDTGFGMFDSTIDNLGDGTVNSITVGGYGIRGGTFNIGATIGSLTARGNGSTLPVTAYESVVRQSETGTQFDPITGQPISFLNDIGVLLGTTAATPVIAGVTDSGVIEDLTLTGSREADNITAWSIRGRVLTNPDTTGFILSKTGGASSISITTFNIANKIGNLTVAGPVNGLVLVTGRTTQFNFGGSVANLSMNVAGPIGNLVFKSSLLGSSSIVSSGPSGKIGSLVVHGNFSGTIKAIRGIGSIIIFRKPVRTRSVQNAGFD